jgi:hypothetical protein
MPSSENPIRELSADELDAAAGGSLVRIIIEILTKDCLRRLTREGTVIDCRYPAYPN